ncbi:MAG: DUF2818 family protein [Hydrogenophaga sp.]|nr:DUF2818 family protein [Hydrogenophaga sp.]
MSSGSISVWLVLLSAVVAANLPFANQRWFGVIPRSAPKSWGVHLLELVVFYFLVGGLALALEKADGQIYPQGWEFYATTAALFLTLAFPGFVFRYLYKRHG